MHSLIAPTAALHAAWSEAHAEWGPDPTRTAESSRHTCTYWWIVDDGRVLGGMALRHGDDQYTRWAGHLGFGIRPSARRRGLASWAVREVLARASERGIERVLAVCDARNLASAMTIERCGGVPEGIRDTDRGPVRRFWFSTRPLSRVE